MRRRYALILLYVLAGCATPAGKTPVPPAPESTPPHVAEVPKAPAGPITPPTASGDMVFDVWAQQFYARALAAGVTRETLDRELAGLTPDPRATSLDSRQPEFSKPVSDYLKGVVSGDRAAIGARRRADLTFLAAVEEKYGVPRDILLAIWALESGFGAIQGDMDVVRSLASLAAQGRRRDWAEGELIAVLKVIQAGEHPRSRLKGSWAGAMGQTQFIPTTFASTAVDFDGDGKRDIWGSQADALASAANLLKKAGWVAGQSWAREVSVPDGFDWSVTEGPRLTPSEWEAKGVKRADGLPWSPGDATAQAQLVAPAGAGGPAFLLFPNHFAIRKYNNSLAYALGVGMLADSFTGQGKLARAWPDETPLALVDRMTAQRALAALGFDPGQPDGVVGAGTRKALRDWQKARGLVADGYLSPAMVQKLKTEAGAS
ncbi:lytic murein transglycosylase [Phenylobacterium sp.]|jgi:lytic murein transglycosylase|uniref:lytic murein transglycosylase n=1 Tax=Phenylobacterium sp. TaxID=1871053 RepID=UPI002F93F3E9